MAHRVATQRVTLIQNLLEDFGVAQHLFPDHKKGGRHAPCAKLVQHPRREVGIRAVVECEVDGIGDGC